MAASADSGIFQEKLHRYLCSQLIPRYVGVEVQEQRHYEHIGELIEYANSVGTSVLGSRGYKYGVAQKLLNLALKYYWCLGEIAEPPHCPVDRVVIDETRYKGKINWTEIEQKSEYQMIIEEIKRQAGTQSVAMWELCVYNRR